MVSAILLGVAAGAYTSGIIARFLAEERRRRRTGWLVAVAWTVSLSGLLLATAAPALADLSIEDLRIYLAGLLAPNIVVVPILLLVFGYVIWRARSAEPPWMLLALALLFQVPVCLLVTVEGWAPRQFLIPQTLLFCAGAALAVAAGKVALRQRGYTRRLLGIVVAAALMVLLLGSFVERVRALLLESPETLSEQHMVASQADDMIDWMAKNVPEGKNILVNAAQGNYLAFLDGGRHEWTRLRLDQERCVPRPNTQIRCNPDKNAVSRTPPDAVWVQRVGRCKVISLSMSNLLGQVRRNGSGYVMISGSSKYPSILRLPSDLEESNAFEVVHTERGHKGKSGAEEGVVLLKSTGRAPGAVPTQMDASTVFRLKRCERASSLGYEQTIRSMSPNGLLKVPD
jgi:hypothetical protein